MEKPVTFKNQTNQNLFGILHTPENEIRSNRHIGVSILSPGLKGRVAPNRLNVKIARMLSEKGFYVFRFDPFGIGDSEGQLSEKNERVFNLWGMVQKGLFLDDTVAANKFFIEIADLKKLILIGQCGGGVTALFCSKRDKNIDALILIDTPFRIVSSNTDMQDIVAEYNKPDELVKNGIQYMLKLQKLKKLMTLNINWRLYFNALYAYVQNAISINRHYPIKEISDRFNWQMLQAFQDFMSRKGHVYFMFAENDFTLKEFSQDFKPNFLDGNDLYKAQCKIDIIKNANHIYTEIAWQKELMNNILDWINTYY